MIKKIASFITAIVTFFTALFGGYADVYLKDYVKFDLPYGTHERQVLDICIPKKAKDEIGLILFIHGGAWIMGDKKSYRNELKYWSDSGYAAAAINYRYVSDDVDLNNITDDITSALSAIKSFGESKKININKVLLTGSSAGAHLSLLYGYSRVDEAPIKPAAIVSYCGPVDLTNPKLYWGPDLNGNSDLGTPEVIADLLSKCCSKTFSADNIDSAKEELLQVSPISYVGKDSVPTVIAHGACDTVVPYDDSIALDKKLTEYGVKHDYVTYPNSNHGLESDPVSNATARKLFKQYANEYLK